MKNCENYSDIILSQPCLPILIVDASLFSLFPHENATKFDVFLKLINTIESNFFRIIFWNCNNFSFKNGVIVIDKVAKKKLKQIFYFVKHLIDKQCYSRPHTGIANIPKNWLLNNPIIYYFATNIINDPCVSSKLLKTHFILKLRELFDCYPTTYFKMHLIRSDLKNYKLPDISCFDKCESVNKHIDITYYPDVEI